MRKSVALSWVGLLVLTLGLALSAGAETRATVTIRLTEPLSTGSSQVGDTFTGTLVSPLVVSDRIVAEKDAEVSGQVLDVVSSGRLKRPALIRLRVKAVRRGSGQIPLQTGDLTVKADSHARRDLLIIGGAIGTGAAIGGAAAGKKGALIGAAAGSGAGITSAYLTGKREIVLPQETLLTFHVNSVVISQKELARLQRVGHPDDEVQLRRRRHHHDDDDEEEFEYEAEHEHEHEGKHEIKIKIKRPD